MELSDQERLFRQRKKWMWGCTGGCLGLMVVLAAVIIGIWLWFAHALPVPAAEAFLTPTTSAFLFVRIGPDDPMMVEVPVRLAVQPVVRSQVPTKDNQPMQVDPERMRKAVIWAAPIQMIVIGTVSEDDPQILHWGVAVSVTALGRALDAVLKGLASKQGLPAPEPYKGGSIVMVPDQGGGFALRTNTYMIAEQKALLRAWLDGIQADLARDARSEAGPALPEGLAPQLVEAYDSLDRSSPVRFGCLNAHGEIAALLARLPAKEVAARLTKAGMGGPGVRSLSGQLRSMNSRDAALTLRVSCADDGTAAAVEAALKELVGNGEKTPHLRDPLVQARGDHTVELTGRIENLPDRIADLVSEAEQQGQ
jgi:hypothetical protein